MPRSVAQWTALFVTAIIALGCDRDVFYAIPIGVLAGAMAGGLIALDEYRLSRHFEGQARLHSRQVTHSRDAARPLSR